MRTFALRPEFRHRATAFGAAACAYLWCYLIARSGMLAAHPTALALAVTADLTGTATMLVWWLGVRPGYLPRAALLMTALTGLATAVLALPATRALRWQSVIYVWAAGELALVTLLLVRVARVVRGLHGALAAGHSLSEALELGLQHALPGRRLLPRLVAHELTVLVYAFSGWFRRPGRAPGEVLIAHAGLLEYRAIACALALLSLGEGLACHVLLQGWSPLAAWIGTGLHVYGLLWLSGDYHALRLNPLRLSATTLHIELGLRGRASIPLTAIRSIRPLDATNATAHVALTVRGAPQWLIELREEAPVTRFFRTQLTRAIALRGDDLAQQLRSSGLLAYRAAEI